MNIGVVYLEHSYIIFTCLSREKGQTPRMNVNRDVKRIQRRRGVSQRNLDLDDLVLSLPPPNLSEVTLSESDGEQEARGDAISDFDQHSESDNEDDNIQDSSGSERENWNNKEGYRNGRNGHNSIKDYENKTDDQSLHANNIPNLVPPPAAISAIMESESRIIQQHQVIARERSRMRQEERKLARQKAKVGKHTSKRALIQSKSIKIKYRRIPSNKIKLIYVDVIAQMLKDYIKDKNVLQKYTERVKELKKTLKKRGRRESDKTIESNCREILNDYYQRTDEYFGSLIDLRLSNSLIKNDLNKINQEKNMLRLQIFDLRQERNLIGVEMKQVRNEFKTIRASYSENEKLYKDLISLKEKGTIEGESNNVMDSVRHKLNKLESMVDSKLQLLQNLKTVNELLREKVDKTE